MRPLSITSEIRKFRSLGGPTVVMRDVMHSQTLVSWLSSVGIETPLQGLDHDRVE